MRLLLFVFLLSLPCRATDPRKQPADYPAHADSSSVALGTEYLVHSVPTGHQTYFVPGFLVVDVAVYPKGGELKIDNRAFHLRVNGRAMLDPVAAQMVAYSIQFAPDGSSSQTAFPGAPTNRPTPVPQAPDARNPEGSGAPDTPAEALARFALPNGEFHSPQGGFLYFAYSGKTKNIHSLELVYSGKPDDLEVPLF